jgi:hypothetical protein
MVEHRLVNRVARGRKVGSGRVRAGTQHVLVLVLATRRRVNVFYLFTHFLICLDRRSHVPHLPGSAQSRPSSPYVAEVTPRHHQRMGKCRNCTEFGITLRYRTRAVASLRASFYFYGGATCVPF